MLLEFQPHIWTAKLQIIMAWRASSFSRWWCKDRPNHQELYKKEMSIKVSRLINRKIPLVQARTDH